MKTIGKPVVTNKRKIDMNVFDKLNIEPGYAMIFHDVTDYTYEFAKFQLEKNGFTVQDGYSDSDELREVIVIRRINLPNIGKNAYIYISMKDFDASDAREAIDDFCETALNVQDPREGHLHFIREEEPRIRSLHSRERGVKCMRPLLFVDDNDDEDDDEEIDEAEREDIIAMQMAAKSSNDINEIISRLIQIYALKEHTFTPIDHLFEATMNKMVIATAKRSTIRVNRRLEVFLPEYDNMKFGFSTKMRIVYSLFLRHPKGIFMNSLDDYLQEVIDLIKKAAPGERLGLGKETAKKLCEPNSEEMNRMISKINHVISCHIHPNSLKADSYRIIGSRGNVYKIEMANQTTFA